MNKFNVGDKVIIKSTIGSTNEVVKIHYITPIRYGDTGEMIKLYCCTNNRMYPDYKLELWKPKTDLEGRYKMKEISMDKQYKTRDGRDVEIISIKRNLKFPVLGIIDNSDAVVQWDLYGGRAWCAVESPSDLIELSPYADFKVDDKVLVRTSGSKWVKRHFYNADDGTPYTFDDGATSFTWSGREIDTSAWEKCVKWEDRTDDMVICND